LAAGKIVKVEALVASVEGLSFEAKTHHLKYHSSPMHGNGASFLYDLDSKKQLLSCGDEDQTPACLKLNGMK
jgi:hypothetical protein